MNSIQLGVQFEVVEAFGEADTDVGDDGWFVCACVAVVCRGVGGVAVGIGGVWLVLVGCGMCMNDGR